MPVDPSGAGCTFYSFFNTITFIINVCHPGEPRSGLVRDLLARPASRSRLSALRASAGMTQGRVASSCVDPPDKSKRPIDKSPPVSLLLVITFNKRPRRWIEAAALIASARRALACIDAGEGSLADLEAALLGERHNPGADNIGD
jgi:hypothetical protein